jgi:hypothetical protein
MDSKFKYMAPEVVLTTYYTRISQSTYLKHQ